MSGGQAWRRKMVAGLLAGTAAPIENEVEDVRSRARNLMRVHWALERVDALRRANKAMVAAWMAMLAPYDDVDEEDLPDFDPPPEELAAEAIHAEIRAALDEDRWPAFLHWSV